MVDVSLNTLLYCALPLFIGHYVLLDYLQWREPKSRIVFSAIGCVIVTVSLIVLAIPVHLNWDDNFYWLLLVSVFCVAPIVSVWEAGVLRLCGWKYYSDAFDTTLRINRLIPVALWAILYSHDAFNSDRELQSVFACAIVAIIQWLGLLAYANKGKGGSLCQALATKAATLIVLFCILQPVVLSYCMLFEPIATLSTFLVAVFLMALTLTIVGWSTYATSTRKALEIGVVVPIILLVVRALGILPYVSSTRSHLFDPRFVLSDAERLCNVAIIASIIMAYCFISFHIERTIVRRPRLVPSIVCAVVFGMATQVYIEHRVSETTAALALVLLPPLAVALIIRRRIWAGEQSKKLGNFGLAQVQLEAGLNLLHRFSNYGSELVVRCLVGLADATAAQNLFLQSHGFVEKALDTIGSGVRPRPDDLESLRRLVVDLHGKTGLSKTNALQERLDKLIPVEVDVDEKSAETGVGAASAGAETSAGDKKNGTAAQKAGGEPAASQSKEAPGAMPTFSIPLFNDSSLRALPLRVASLTASAPTWDKSSRDRVAPTPPPLAMPAFAKSSGMELVVARDHAYSKPDERSLSAPAGTWIRSPAEPNLFSMPGSASWMKVADQADHAGKARSDWNMELDDGSSRLNSSLKSDGRAEKLDGSSSLGNASLTLSVNDSTSPTDAIDCDSAPSGTSKRKWFHAFHHKKRDRFDDDSGSVFFNWKLWTIKILILVCCPTLLAVSTGLNYLASRNRDLAEICMSSSLTINQVVLGSHNLETGYAHRSLGQYYLSHDKDELAFLNLRSALSILNENQAALPKTVDNLHQHNNLRNQVATLAESLGDLETAAQTWIDIDTALSDRSSLVKEEASAIPDHTSYTSGENIDRFGALVHAARLRALQEDYSEACRLYNKAFSQRWSFADSNLVPTRYSIDWTRPVQSSDYYLEAARAATNYALLLDSHGNKNKSWVMKRLAHVFATRYLQEYIMNGIKNAPATPMPLCATIHDTRVAMTVFATGHVSNLRVVSASNHPYCDNCGLTAVESALASSFDRSIQSAVPVPVELICPVDIEIGFKNLPEKPSSESAAPYAFIP